MPTCDATPEGRTIARLTYLPVVNKDWRTTVALESYTGSAETGVCAKTIHGRTINIPARAIFSLEVI